MKRRVMHILNSSQYSGAENVVITIINHLKESYDLCYVSREGAIRDKLNQENIEFIPIKNMSISEIKRVVKLNSPDLIHAHDFTASIICAASSCKVPVISHLHNNSPWLSTYHINSFAYLFSSVMYKRIFMVSDAVLNEYVFRKFILKKSIIIGNPIDIKQIEKRSKEWMYKGTYDVLFLGRLSEQKNPLRFIKVIKEVSRGKNDLKCAMIGQGELEPDCRKLIEELGLEDNIELLGFQDNPFPILSKSEMLCITSDWEGYGLVAVEALTNGIPVLATPVGGLLAIVDDACGKICRSDEAFIEEILRLKTNPEYYQKKKDKALQKASKLDNVKRYMGQLNQCYSHVIRGDSK